jgi:hypothetical protein
LDGESKTPFVTNRSGRFLRQQFRAHRVYTVADIDARPQLCIQVSVFPLEGKK